MYARKRKFEAHYENKCRMFLFKFTTSLCCVHTYGKNSLVLPL